MWIAQYNAVLTVILLTLLTQQIGIKVPEPKTPYHGPVPEGWEDEMKPLHLDDHGGNQGGNSGGVSAFDLCYDNGAGGNGECDILVLGEGSAPSSSSIHQEGATAEGMVSMAVASSIANLNVAA